MDEPVASTGKDADDSDADPGVPTSDVDATSPPTAGLVLHFTMDEGAGMTVRDSSAHAHTATFNAASGAWVPGRFGTALNLASTGPLAVASSPAINDISQGVTIAAWVKRLKTATKWAMVLSRQRQGTPEEHYGLGFVDDVPSFTTEYNNRIGAASTAPAGTWLHLAGTYDGVVQRIYLDGTIVSSKPAVRRLTADTTPVLIGANQNFSTVGELFEGIVDDVRLYDRALAAEEIAALAAAP